MIATTVALSSFIHLTPVAPWEISFKKLTRKEKPKKALGGLGMWVSASIETPRESHGGQEGWSESHQQANHQDPKTDRDL